RFVRPKHRIAFGRGRSSRKSTFRQLHPVSLRQRLEGFKKRQPVHPHDEVEHAPAGPASETVKEAALRVDRKRRSLLLMERAEAAKITAGSFEPDFPANPLDNTRAVPNFLDFVIAELPHHPASNAAIRSG